MRAGGDVGGRLSEAGNGSILPPSAFRLPPSYIHPLRIGGLLLQNNLCLAPMAGFSNLALRLIAKEVGGCGLVATEMVAAIAQHDTPGNRIRFGWLTATVPEERPVAMQVYGREPERCARTARALADAGADLVDLNCGCPVKKAKQAGCGVALMQEPDQVGRIVAAMRAAVPERPLTVKMRLGYSGSERTAVAVARAALDAGADALFVHARTGESKHGVPIELAGVREVKDLAVAMTGDRVPVIANGSLDTAAAIRAAKDQGGADGYQIGRAACGDPWLFRNLIAELGGGQPHRPSLEERKALLLRHIDLVLGLYGEGRGVPIMRKYAFFYCNGLPGVRAFRERFCRVRSRAEFHDLVQRFFADLVAGGVTGPVEHLTLRAEDAADAHG